MAFTRDDTQVVKGVAIAMMLTHHLFAFPERTGKVGYLSLTPFLAKSAEYRLGVFSQLCVALFLFVSGYGMYSSLSRRNERGLHYALTKFRQFLRTYWVCFALFVPIGLVFFSDQAAYRWAWKQFLLSLAGLSASYNGEWWFVELYFELLLLFPLLFYAVRASPWLAFCGSFFLFFLAWDNPAGVFYSLPVLLLQNLCIWQFPFIVGLLFARGDLFAKLEQVAGEKPALMQCLVALVTIFLIRHFYSHTSVDAFIAPFFAYYVARLLGGGWSRRVFATLGKYSMPMWLVHTFFCYYYFQWLVFLPRLSVLILVWLVALSLAAAWLIGRIEQAVAAPFSRPAPAES